MTGSTWTDHARIVTQYGGIEPGSAWDFVPYSGLTEADTNLLSAVPPVKVPAGPDSMHVATVQSYKLFDAIMKKGVGVAVEQQQRRRAAMLLRKVVPPPRVAPTHARHVACHIASCHYY